MAPYDSTTSQAWMFATPVDSRIKPAVEYIPEDPSFRDLIQQLLSKFQLQSPSHFARHIFIECLEDTDTQGRSLNSSSRLKIEVSTWTKRVTLVCHRCLRQGRYTNRISVRDKRQWMTLWRYLASRFPPEDGLVTEQSMQRWWASNGKSFNWKGLPAELKENILHYCIRNYGTTQPDYFHGLPLSWLRVRRSSGRSCEATQRLGAHSALLYVSMEVRSMTLKLCFNGSKFFPHGLCITSLSDLGFETRIRQLERHYQTIEPNSVVHEGSRSHFLAMRYQQYPTLYRQLKRYATYVQAIRKVCLEFGFCEYLSFFKINTNFFLSWQDPRVLKYEVFDRMPNLVTLAFLLPTHKKHRLDEPSIFHKDFPCPRIILRLIYERIAEALPQYGDVRVTNFLDDDELERFSRLRDKALPTLKFQPTELKEMYTDIEGDIELGGNSNLNTETVQTTPIPTSAQNTSEESAERSPPPRCQCSRPCERIFRGLDPVD